MADGSWNDAPAGPGPADPGPAGPPPPPWRRRRRRWLLAIGGAAIVALLVVGIGFGVAAMRTFADDLSLTSADEGPAAEEGPDPGSPDAEEPIPAPEFDELDGADAELADILVDIDRSEQQMLATQTRFAELLAAAAAGPDADGDELAEDLAGAAGEGQEALQELRSDLAAAPSSSSAIREVRDVYLDHLDAWVRYFVAIEADPILLAGGEDDASYLLAINTSGDAFARSVREGLPDDLDPEVREYAERIVDRGFPERELSPDDTV